MAKKKITVIKMDGKKEKFDKDKLIKSIVNAGAPEEEAKKIADEVEKKIKEGEISSRKIRRIVLKLLEEENPEWADNWKFYDRVVKGRITYEDGKFVVIEKGNLYLGREVKDIGPKGLSHYEEVKDILEELEEDLEHGVSPRTIQSRTYVLFMAVLRSKKMKKSDKEKAIKAINEFREKHGWKPYELKRPLE